ncbi:universal stress protein [Nocardia sp. NPDC051052]|uniref:universal stress protein n=1 Tax=Nocardia sp. NPDC051052 TaxID=3364322 RepID=UPI00378E494E
MPTSPTIDPRRLATAVVVVGVDGSAASDLTVEWAADTASRHNRRLNIVHGFDLAASAELVGSYDVLVPAVTDELRRHGVDLVTASKLAYRVDPALDVETEVAEANPARLLIRRSESSTTTAAPTTGRAPQQQPHPRLFGAHEPISGHTDEPS